MGLYVQITEEYIPSSETEKITGAPKQLCNKEFHNLCSTSNTMVSKSRSARWVGHLSCMGGMRNEYKILVRKPIGKRCLGHILKWILKK
jgi:hypothetical protein